MLDLDNFKPLNDKHGDVSGKKTDVIQFEFMNLNNKLRDKA